MKAWVSRITLAAMLCVLQTSTVVFAESTIRTLPTLLIKGTVESLNTAEDGQMLLKVKDRYGFETPIYLTDAVTMVRNGDGITLVDLKPGTNVEVEYNFDVNTAKRQGVVVVVADSAVSAQPKPAAPAPESTVAAPETEIPAEPSEVEMPVQESEAVPAE